MIAYEKTQQNLPRPLSAKKEYTMGDQIYQTDEVILETARIEYQNEHNRTSIIDSKTNIILSFTAVIFVAFIPMINLKNIITVSVVNFGDCILPISIFVFLILSMLSMFLSILSLIKCVFTKEYKVIDTEYFYDINKLKENKDLYSIALAQFYIEATDINKEINDNRIKNYKKGVICTILSVMFFAVYVILFSLL